MHLWWRGRFLRAREAARSEVEALKDEQRRAALQVQTQQEVLFDSMLEGLLLLDEQRAHPARQPRLCHNVWGDG